MSFCTCPVSGVEAAGCSTACTNITISILPSGKMPAIGRLSNKRLIEVKVHDIDGTLTAGSTFDGCGDARYTPFGGGFNVYLARSKNDDRDEK